MYSVRPTNPGESRLHAAVFDCAPVKKTKKVTMGKFRPSFAATPKAAPRSVAATDSVVPSSTKASSNRNIQDFCRAQSSQRVPCYKVSVDDDSNDSVPSTPHPKLERIVPAFTARKLFPVVSGAASAFAAKKSPATPAATVRAAFNVAPPSKSALKAPSTTDVSTPHGPSSAKKAPAAPRKRAAPSQPSSTPASRRKKGTVVE